MIDEFIARYDGMFGRFEEDDGMAISPDGDNESMVTYEVCEDIVDSYTKKVDFIENKRKKVMPMGKMVDFDCPYGFDDYYACILNYNLMGKTGGFLYFTGRKGNVLAFAKAYRTSDQEQITDEGRDEFIRTIYDCIE